jgi:hypothetical protein
MKTKIIILFFLLLTLTLNLKGQDVYNNKIDSILVAMGNLIYKDLKTEGIIVLKRPHIGFGDSFELKVILDSKQSAFITFLSRPESIKNKIIKKRHQFKYKKFFNYVSKYNELPYDLFDSFSYKFLQGQSKGESFEIALFGQYIFKADPKGLRIIDKKIEFLSNEKAVLEKFNSVW